jgi:hypothetical protein
MRTHTHTHTHTHTCCTHSAAKLLRRCRQLDSHLSANVHYREHILHENAFLRRRCRDTTRLSTLAATVSYSCRGQSEFLESFPLMWSLVKLRICTTTCSLFPLRPAAATSRRLCRQAEEILVEAARRIHDDNLTLLRNSM